MKPLSKPPHEMTTHPTLGPLAKAINAIDSDWMLVQHGTAEVWLRRMLTDLEHAKAQVEVMLRRMS